MGGFSQNFKQQAQNNKAGR